MRALAELSGSTASTSSPARAGDNTGNVVVDVEAGKTNNVVVTIP
jgi:hypothetical protein